MSRGRLGDVATPHVVLYDGQRFLFPKSGTADASVVRGFLADTAPPIREILEPSLPVLVGPWEVVFQYPTAGLFDRLQIIEAETQELEDFPDATRVVAQLVRYTSSRGVRVLALELPGYGALNLDPLAYTSEFGGLAVVNTPDDTATLFLLGKQLARGSRQVAELSRRRSQLSGRRALILHTGDARSADVAQRQYCAEAIAGLGVFAIVPREGELELGVDALMDIVEKHHLPYVATNLLDSGGQRRFRRFVTTEIGGLTVAVVGIVGSDQLQRLPASVKGQWTVESPNLALPRALHHLEEQLGKHPDLTIALEGAVGDDHAKVLAVSHVDIVLADASRPNLTHTRERLEIADPGARERSRRPHALLAIRSSPYAIGHLEAGFEPARDGGRAHLRSIVHETEVVLAEGPRDADLEARWRPVEEAQLEAFSKTLLPDVAPLLARHPELHAMVWGDRILHRRSYRRYDRHYPARYSDALWMRVVTNLLKQAAGADVAVSRNLPRGSDMIGPISQGIVLNWLPASDAVRVVEVSGVQLGVVARRLADQRAASPENQLFSAGLEAERLLVAGHPVNLRARYRLVTTDYVLAMPELAEAFAGAPTVDRFSVSAGDLVDADSGQELLVRDVILSTLDQWRDGRGNFDPTHVSQVEQALLDDPQRVTAEA